MDVGLTLAKKCSVSSFTSFISKKISNRIAYFLLMAWILAGNALQSECGLFFKFLFRVWRD